MTTLREALTYARTCIWNGCNTIEALKIIDNALSPPSGGDEATTYRVEYDGFVGNKIGSYVTREGKHGVVLQQIGSKVVHVYGQNRITPDGDEAKESDWLCNCSWGCVEADNCRRREARKQAEEKPITPIPSEPSPPPDRREIVARECADELVQIVEAAERVAKRTGNTFVIDRAKVAAMIRGHLATLNGGK